MRTLFVILIGFGLAVAAIADAPKSGGRGQVVAASAAVETASSGISGGEVRDVLLMLDDGPLHLRFHMTLAGVSLTDGRSAYVDRLMKSLDTNGDGQLSADEYARSPLRVGGRPRTGAAFLESIDGKRMKTRKDLMKDVEVVGGELVVYRQDVSAATNDIEVFKFLDADGSGFIDKSEMDAAAARILERDQDQDECIVFQEFIPPPEPDPDDEVAVRGRPGAVERPVATVADLLRDVSEPLLPGRLIKKYDRNHDNKLTADELGWDAERVKTLDRDGDGKLDPRELGRIASTPVHLALSIDLTASENGRPSLVVISTEGQRIDDARRPDVLRLAFSKAVLTLSLRKVDSIKTALASAMRAFNQLDVDGNGYLDKLETEKRVRFEHGGLFDALDVDGDGKIFGEEMEKYVKVRGEPAATTGRVNVYDTGRGFFESLDTNGDGRISMREVQGAGKSLQSLARKDPSKLSPDDPGRNFHIEFLRGSFLLFGPADQMVAQSSPTFEQRAAIGPMWFQRMDRNNDGDLTWNEFLGPREVFRRLDKDGDGLVDSQEALAATEK